LTIVRAAQSTIVAMEIGIVGDYRGDFEPHAITDAALRQAGGAPGVELRWSWIHTTECMPERLRLCHGLWIAPGSPYRSLDGALAAIRWAREARRPVFGTCAGFQHMVLEFARNVAGIPDAYHQEYGAQAGTPLLTEMTTCPLAGKTLPIQIQEGTLPHRAYGASQAEERYYCRYGVNPQFRAALEAAGLQVAAVGDTGEARIIVLPSHPFFVSTLFVPGPAHPLVAAFVDAVRRFHESIGEKVNLAAKLARFHEHWRPKIVGELNGQQVKLVKFQGEFLWHYHAAEDELFYVVRGGFRMEYRDRSVELREGEFLIVPRGVEHRPVADQECHVLLFEPATTLNTGNVRNERTVAAAAL
jgi:mannose-6-phosphate isomerase-like protein (cupin superfamily)